MPAENSVETVMRLLEKNIEIWKDDASRAAIYVGKEWYDRELFTNFDGQISIDLAESREQKLEVTGRLRRRLATLRVNVWAADRSMRDKIVEEVMRVIREHSTNPNHAMYHYKYATSGGDNQAYECIGGDTPPDSSTWTELSDADYEKIWASDDDKLYRASYEEGESPCLLFKYKVENSFEVIKRIVLLFEGYGLGYSGSTPVHGITIKVWNHNSSQWELPVNGTWSQDQELYIIIEENIANYIDENGYVYLLARTRYASKGSTNPAWLYCDYVNCDVTIDGITFLDVVSYRSADRVDVKPFIFRTEFQLKSWLFEKITT